MLRPEPITFQMPSIHDGQMVVRGVRAWTTQTPGVVVHETKWADDQPLTEAELAKAWTVTHLRSGCAICGVPGPEQAMAVAEKLGSLPFDFTVSGAELEAAVRQWQTDTGQSLFKVIAAVSINGPLASRFSTFYRV